MRARSEHSLAIEVACPRQQDRTAKRNLTGVFQHGDCLDPEWNPGGIWRPLRIEETGPVRIASLAVTCVEATTDRAVVEVRAVLDAKQRGAVELRTTVGDPRFGTQHAAEHQLAAGENRVTWRVTVNHPLLWWPHALGTQVLQEVTVAATPLDAGAASHIRTLRTGLRQVRMKRWILSVNGERLFLKGANLGPTRMALAEATAEELERDVVLAKDAGLDLLRVHAHISRPELYDAADRHGMLLWQDLPLQWGYARQVRKQAVRQAKEAVTALAHHPSVAIWCAHNAPLALDVNPADPTVNPARLAANMMAAQQLPTWNKTILDGSLKRALEHADPSRPVVAHSGILPHPGSGGTDTHLYFGWYNGNERDFPRLVAAFPRLARFVTEFGAQAVPSGDVGFARPERWPDLEWEHLAAHHSLQRTFFERNGLDPAGFATFEAWRDATQAYQATVIKHHVEYLRRCKYRPTGGFAQFCFADGMPAVTWAVLGHDRLPKAGYQALADACAPVIVTADRPAASYAPGEAVAWDVHAVCDLRHPVVAIRVTATLSWSGGEERWGWEGDLAADSVERIGTIPVVIPDVPGPLILDLLLESADVKAHNRYESRIEHP